MVKDPGADLMQEKRVALQCELPLWFSKDVGTLKQETKCDGGGSNIGCMMRCVGLCIIRKVARGGT